MHKATHDDLVTYQTKRGEVETATIVSFDEHAGALKRLVA